MKTVHCRNFLLLLLLPALSAFVSCDVAEPERYIDNKTYEAPGAYIVLSNYDTTTTIRNDYYIVKIRLECMNFKPQSVFCKINERPAYQLSRSQDGYFEINVNNYNFPTSGRYQCALYVVPQGRGMISYLGIPMLEFRFPIQISAGYNPAGREKKNYSAQMPRNIVYRAGNSVRAVYPDEIQAYGNSILQGRNK